MPKPSLIDEEISKLRAELPGFSAGKSDEELFSLMCFKFFYNDGAIDARTARKVFTDGANDGGVDIVSLVDYDGRQKLVLIQGKKQGSISSSREVASIFEKMIVTYKDFKQNITSRYSETLKRNLTGWINDGLEAGFDVELAMFSSASISQKTKDIIEEELGRNGNLKEYIIDVNFGDDIIEFIDAFYNTKLCVKSGSIEYFKDQGKIQYGENGLMVNISAQSLKKLFNVYKESGLFENNYRYYFKMRRIDEAIKETLTVRRHQFWYLNNGIIIGCSSYHIDGNMIKLTDFSIINGCQTTSLIGLYKGKNEGEDFSIPCKIVCSADDEEKEKFIGAIAEASNSQKPITERDLKSNSPEQRQLKRLLQEHTPPVFLTIKKGEKKVPTKNRFDWQFIDNHELGQLILSFYLQQPGTARSNKRKIFSIEEIYSSVYKRQHDVDGLIDLIRLLDRFKEYVNKLNNDSALEGQPDLEDIYNNGQYYFMALIGFILKVEKGLLVPKKIVFDSGQDATLIKDTIKGKLIKDWNRSDIDDLLKELFRAIGMTIHDAYDKDRDKNISNYLKTDVKYVAHILKRFYNTYYMEKADFNKKFSAIMDIFEI